jgi:phosphoribosyl 1,2-cyclic phosphodiesterase
LSHLHIDHILGLAFYKPLFDEKIKTCLYTCSRDERPLLSQIFGIFAPPYWPVSLDKIVKTDTAQVFADKPITIGAFTVTPFSANHADKTLSYKIFDGEKTIVHLLDNEMGGMDKFQYETMVDHCKNVDLVVFDAAYTVEEYENGKRGFGHSTVEQGIKLAADCGCKNMLFSHFSPQYTDEELNSFTTRFTMAQDGLELRL